MSLRSWSSYIASKPPKGAQRCKTAYFLLKSHFAWRKSATKFLCVKTVSGIVVGHSWPNYPCKNDWWEWPLLPEILDQTDRVGAKSQIFCLFLLVAIQPAITPSEKSSINTNRKSTTQFQMSPRWILYVVLCPQRGLKNEKYPKFEQ